MSLEPTTIEERARWKDAHDRGHPHDDLCPIRRLIADVERLEQEQVPHAHREYVEGCFRCNLSPPWTRIRHSPPERDTKA
jgi:hypothetical protein